MTELWHVLRGEVEGGGLWTRHEFDPNRLSASRLVHRARKTMGVSGAVASWPSPLISPYNTARLCDVLLPHPPHTLGTRNRNAGVQGNAKKCPTGTRKAKEKLKSSGTRERKGPQERAPIWLHGQSEKCLTAREQHIFSHTIFYHVPLARWQQKTLQRPGRPVRNSFYTFLFLIYWIIETFHNKCVFHHTVYPTWLIINIRRKNHRVWVFFMINGHRVGFSILNKTSSNLL